MYPGGQTYWAIVSVEMPAAKAASAADKHLQILEFGGQAPSGFPYAAVAQEGGLWIFEFPLDLYWQVEACLTIPVSSR